MNTGDCSVHDSSLVDVDYLVSLLPKRCQYIRIRSGQEPQPAEQANQAHCWVLRVQATRFGGISETSDLGKPLRLQCGTRDRPFLENFTVDASI